MAQVPPPPHAEGKKIFSFPNVLNSELPAETVSVRSPLIKIFTGPDCTSFFWAINKSPTKRRMIRVNAMAELARIVNILALFFEGKYRDSPCFSLFCSRYFGIG